MRRRCVLTLGQTDKDNHFLFSDGCELYCFFVLFESTGFAILAILKTHVMSSSRIDQLQQFYQEDPTDPFNLYALALEQQKTDGHKAIELFARLIKEHPEYIPTYYHLGRAYQDLGNRDQALKTFMAGIEQARRHSDLKSLRELHAAHQDLLFDIE